MDFGSSKEMPDRPLEHYEFGFLCLVEILFTTAFLRDVELRWSYANLVIFCVFQLVHHYYWFPAVTIAAIFLLFTEIWLWHHEPKHFAGHLAQHVSHPLCSLSTSWTHVDLKDPGIGILIQQDVKTNKLERAINVFHALTACLHSLHNDISDVLFEFWEVLPESRKNFLKLLFAHNAVTWIFEAILIQGIVAEVSGQPR